MSFDTTTTAVRQSDYIVNAIALLRFVIFDTFPIVIVAIIGGGSIRRCHYYHPYATSCVEDD
jgi:hypothetical protein